MTGSAADLQRAASTSRTALQAALEGAAADGADTQLIWVRDLELPLYTAERAIPAAAHQLAETAYRCDAMIWSSPTYHGSVSGSFKNALDWLILLAERGPPYLPNKPVGLVATAGGIQGLQAVNSMDFIARALQAEGTCDYAEDRQFQANGSPAEPKAGRPGS